MLILFKARQRDPSLGYATTFYRQMEEVLGPCLDRGIKVVANAGGLNPAALADRLRTLAAELGIVVAVAHVEGDDILGRLPGLRARGCPLAHLDTGAPLDPSSDPVSANAYLGGFGIAEALAGGADVVVTGRVTDASLVVGPAAWHFGWQRYDWDRLAGAVVVGHVLECGAQVTGGNYSFFGEVPGLEHPGFPIAEMEADGSAVITKHPGTGGLVSVGTVTAQLLYEIGGPLYANADVVADFSTIHLEQQGPDRVRLSGVRGGPAPEELKVSINLLGGWRNTMTFVLTGLDIEAKADLVQRTLWESLGGVGSFADHDVRLIRTRQTRRRHQRAGQRPAPGHGQERRPRGRGTTLLQHGHRDGAGQLPRLLPDVPARGRHRLRRLLADPGGPWRRRRGGRPPRRPSGTVDAPAGTRRRRRHGQHGGARRSGSGVSRRCPPARRRRRHRRAERHPAASARAPRRGPFGGQRGQCQRRALGRRRGRLRLAARRAHRRAAPAAPARGGRARHRPLRAAQPVGPQLRRPRTARAKGWPRRPVPTPRPRVSASTSARGWSTFPSDVLDGDLRSRPDTEQRGGHGLSRDRGTADAP